MKNLKKYKDGIIYNIITVNSQQPKQRKRQKTTQPNKYNPQFRGMQYYPPPPSYADYGMNRFNTGNSQNTNIQDQYLREKVKELEGKLNPDNNLSMIEDLQDKINELYDEQYNQKEYTNTAGKYLLDFERQINDRFEKLKAPYSFDDSAGAFAESLNDNDFISQIGNDDNDDDEEMSTPFIIDKRKRFTNPRKFEQPLQIKNEPFFTSPIEEEESAPEFENIYETPEENFYTTPETKPKEWLTFFNNAKEINEFQKRYPEFKYGEEDPREYLKKEPEKIEGKINIVNTDEFLNDLISYNDSLILKGFDPSIPLTDFKKITYNDIVKNKKYNNVINLITPTKEEIKISPSLPIPVEDINDDEEEEEKENIISSIKIRPGRPKTEDTAKKIKEYEKEYKRLTGKEIKYFGIYNLSETKKIALKNYNNVKNIFNELKIEVEKLGGTVDETDNINDLEKKKETLTSKLENLKSLYKNLGGSDNDILQSGNINDVESAYKLIKPKKKSTKKK